MKKIIALIVMLLVTGCTSFLQISPHTTAVNHYLSWAQRKTQLTQLQKWQANGSIASHNKNGTGIHTSFHWQQDKDTYQLRLLGPLGTGSILLLGKPRCIALMTGNRVIKATNAETLLAQEAGLNLPVSQLYYWLRGLPAPQLRHTINLDAYNRLRTLRQLGWQIEYSQYTNAGEIDIPKYIVLTHSPWQLRVLVTHWHID